MPASLPNNLSSASPLTTESLPIAIGNLLKMNNYDVAYDVHVHGAQVDIVAKSKTDPFAKPLYIEATVEYVSTEKYGKDATKFHLLSTKNPSSTLICVTSSGFTASVRERAKESGVLTLTYDELFARFEKFSPYLEKILHNEDIIALDQNYEEPLFNDAKGVDDAIDWLRDWKNHDSDKPKWLIVLGEYGTGKTSLTKILQRRWLSDYRSNPSAPIPIRIELRNFSRQFDANGLLHHFLDTHDLAHVPIDFLNHLIRTGRVILLLDGYDEMAQFMNARERRSCLSALAELAKDGAKGLLTSRPNYFSEAEELNVFEALYRNLEQQRYHIAKGDTAILDREKQIDKLVEGYVLNRFERSLQDLNESQTESLVRRTLRNNLLGQQLVLEILRKIFREEAAGSRQSLSGKPVIIAYLLELTAELQAESGEVSQGALTEWEIYKLIIDRLMLRDLARSSLMPGDRRVALQKLAIKLSSRGTLAANELEFSEIVEAQFGHELRRLPVEERRVRRNELFEDLRSSATLTRATGVRESGWSFSHNSLREFLVVEHFINSLLDKQLVPIEIPISRAMRSFVSSLSRQVIEKAWDAIGELWPSRATTSFIGSYLQLLWDSAIRLEDNYVQALEMIGSKGGVLYISNISIKDINFSDLIFNEISSVAASGSDLSEVRFDGLSISDSSFDNAVLDTVSFKDSDISSSSFRGCFLFECNLSGAAFTQADFVNAQIESVVFSDSNAIVAGSLPAVMTLSGNHAMGYLRYNGAKTSDVDDIYVYIHHPKFSIVDKICQKVSEQRNSQLRGLTQRGEARADPPFARSFVNQLKSLGWIEIDQNDLVSATASGRKYMQRLTNREEFPAEFVQFLNG